MDQLTPDLWYDRSLRLWTLLWKDEEDNQVGLAEYFSNKQGAFDWMVRYQSGVANKGIYNDGLL